MRAGKLRTRVVFQKEVKTADGAGGYSLDWGDDRVVPCEMRTASAREILAGGQVEDTERALLSARAKSVAFLDASWRALIDDVPWNIRGVSNADQRQRVTDIVIERGVAV